MEGNRSYSHLKSLNVAGDAPSVRRMSPFEILYTPSPRMDDAGMFTFAPFHHSESSLNSNFPASAVIRAAGGRKGNASICSPDTVAMRFL